jgi:hypothetical protein
MLSRVGTVQNKMYLNFYKDLILVRYRYLLSGYRYWVTGTVLHGEIIWDPDPDVLSATREEWKIPLDTN